MTAESNTRRASNASSSEEPRYHVKVWDSEGFLLEPDRVETFYSRPNAEKRYETLCRSAGIYQLEVFDAEENEVLYSDNPS